MKGVRIEKGLFRKRAAEKRKSRKADERALKSGKKASSSSVWRTAFSPA